jgi:hypothetical protein
MRRIVFGVLVVLAGFGLFLKGDEERRLAAVARADPQTITCAELEEHGPGENAHVVLGDYLLCQQAFVYESRRGKSTWETVWVPAVPLRGAYHERLLALEEGAPIPPPDDIRVIVKTAKAPDEASLARIAGADTLQGLVVNEVEKLGHSEKELLGESYPGIDFGRVWILEHGRTPGGTTKQLLFYAAGLAAGGFGVFLLVRRRRAAKPRVDSTKMEAEPARRRPRR